MGQLIDFKRYTYREGVIMCKILKNIRGKKADEILKIYGQDDSIPVNLNQLLFNIGLSVLPYDFTDIEKQIGTEQGSILGLVKSKEDKAAIYYREKDTLNRQRFTIAHELAHCCLHMIESNKTYVEYRRNESNDNEHEREADIFAGELLIPIKKLREIYLSLAVPSSVTLASKFAVSTNVMEARLNYLKISYFNKDGQAVIYENE